MRNFKLFTMIFAIMVTVCFAACDDKDNNKRETNVCDPATCEMATNATEMACNDVGQCVVKACAETFKVAEDAKSCEADAPTNECNGKSAGDECAEGKTCQDDNGTLTCKDKSVVNECKCNDGTNCPDGDKNKCVQ